MSKITNTVGTAENFGPSWLKFCRGTDIDGRTGWNLQLRLFVVVATLYLGIPNFRARHESAYRSYGVNCKVIPIRKLAGESWGYLLTLDATSRIAAG